jgi:signal recognition particle receptor subunit alpha
LTSSKSSFLESTHLFDNAGSLLYISQGYLVCVFLRRSCTNSEAGGIVLWSRSFTPAAAQVANSSSGPVNSLIRDVLIEGRDAEQKYEKDGYSMKWTFVNDLELIFVVRLLPVVLVRAPTESRLQVAYQRILQITYAEDFLVALKTVFVKLFGPFLTTFLASLHAAGSNKAATSDASQSFINWNFAKAFEGWDAAFDKLLKGFEDKAAQVCSQ